MPLRARLSLAFAAALSLMLALAAAFVYLRVESDLSEILDEGLAVRAHDILIRGSTSDIQRDLDQWRPTEEEDGFAQVLRRGALVASTLPKNVGVAISPDQVRDVRVRGTLFLDADVPGIDGTARILARDFSTPSGEWTTVVGASTEDRDETLAGLRATFLIGAPIAVALMTGLGFLLAGMAVAPVSAALAREREFVGDASHELRTPLAILKTEIELADRDGRTEQELRAALRSSGGEVDRLSQLAEDLLVLARSDQGQMPLRREPIQLEALLARVRDRFAARARQDGRGLVVDAPEGERAEVDPLRVEQALGNLLDNALRHGAGTVTLSAHRSGDHAVFEVTDEGAGFPAAFRERAFERFTRADEGRTGGGSGLGLAIVRAVAEAHGGEASESGPPTTVRVSVPA